MQCDRFAENNPQTITTTAGSSCGRQHHVTERRDQAALDFATWVAIASISGGDRQS
jgi:hypothetical protein